MSAAFLVPRGVSTGLARQVVFVGVCVRQGEGGGGGHDQPPGRGASNRACPGWGQRGRPRAPVPLTPAQSAGAEAGDSPAPRRRAGGGRGRGRGRAPRAAGCEARPRAAGGSVGPGVEAASEAARGDVSGGPAGSSRYFLYKGGRARLQTLLASVSLSAGGGGGGGGGAGGGLSNSGARFFFLSPGSPFRFPGSWRDICGPGTCMCVRAKEQKNGSAQTHRPGRGRRRRRAGRRGAAAGGWGRGAERASELFTRGEGEECVRPPAAPKAGGCSSAPRFGPRPGPSELRARLGGRGAPGAGEGAAGLPLACGGARECVVRGPGLGRGRGGSRCSSGSCGAAQRGLRQPRWAEGRLVRAAGRRTVDGEGEGMAAWDKPRDPQPSRRLAHTAALVWSGCLYPLDMTS